MASQNGNMNNKTIEYYNKKAEEYSTDTFSANVSDLRMKFLKHLEPGDYILDFGCGSGRDTKAFLEAGYCMDAIDGSEELCRIASKNTGISVKCMRFQDLNVREQYNGIWACASLLHLPREELAAVFVKMATALKTGGYLYVSFKYGNFEGERNDRYFLDLTKDSLKQLTDRCGNLVIEETWITGDVRPERAEEKWLNAILKKS